MKLQLLFVGPLFSRSLLESLQSPAIILDYTAPGMPSHNPGLCSPRSRFRVVYFAYVQLLLE